MKSNKRYLVAYIPIVLIWVFFVMPVQLLSLLSEGIGCIADKAEDLSNCMLSKIGAFKVIEWVDEGDNRDQPHNTNHR